MLIVVGHEGHYWRLFVNRELLLLQLLGQRGERGEQEPAPEEYEEVEVELPF